MGISYRVDREQRIVFVVWVGDITAGDLMAHWTTLVADSEAMRCRGSVSDLRGAGQLPHYETLRSSTQTRLRVGLPAGWKAAVIATEPHHRGVARQLAAVVGEFCEVECFDDAATALAWASFDRGGTAALTAGAARARGRP